MSIYTLLRTQYNITVRGTELVFPPLVCRDTSSPLLRVCLKACSTTNYTNTSMKADYSTLDSLISICVCLKGPFTKLTIDKLSGQPLAKVKFHCSHFFLKMAINHNFPIGLFLVQLAQKKNCHES